MAVIIDFWEWKRARLAGKGVNPAIRRRARARRGENALPSGIGDLSAELLRLLSEKE